ncbi:hypothetical protein LCGC14_0920940 [marine sediment metagenome]|uniref:DUF7352 domain-containing protein n=1 Tax=marine sediment metagenome TaxID=412755 RepID=A0A0F9NQY1_9ZZZZ
MKAVWKYPTKPDIFGHELPEGAQVVHFDMQHGEPTMWVLVDTDAPLDQRPFLVAGTGHELPVDARYIASCIDRELGLVWHLFEPLAGGH